MQATLLMQDEPEAKKTYRIPRYELRLVREATVASEVTTITSYEAAYRILAPEMQDYDREMFVVLMLDVKKKLIGLHRAAVGGLTSVTLTMREVFKAAIVANAAAIIVAHNHPSGDPYPSPDDMRVTEELAAAGHALDITVLDHIIVGNGRYYSFMDKMPACFERRYTLQS